MHKFPSIGQFRNAVQSVKLHATYVDRDENGDPIYDESLPAPVIEYEGTVKLHGTNAAVVVEYDENGEIDVVIYQSRNNLITPQDDNVGFAAFAAKSLLATEFDKILSNFDSRRWLANGKWAIYGEWCGSGIQKGTVVNQLEKLFVVFGVLNLNTDRWLEPNVVKYFKCHEKRVYNIYEFPTYKVTIDFNSPETIQPTLEEITNQVEKECPVGKFFNVNGAGEGVVWKPANSGFSDKTRFWFKVKGEKHQVTKTKTLAPVDIEKANNIKELVAKLVTKARLEQGIADNKLDFDRKNLGTFLRWVVDDIMKEELDTIEANGFTKKDVSGEISRAARSWFFEREKESLGI